MRRQLAIAAIVAFVVLDVVLTVVAVRHARIHAACNPTDDDP